jgi:DNA-binding transcriptional regulator LsrR (DeoR family)
MIKKGRGNMQNGAGPRGEDHPVAKVTRAQVAEIRALKGMRQKDIGARYGITQGTVSKIIRRANWR